MLRGPGLTLLLAAAAFCSLAPVWAQELVQATRSSRALFALRLGASQWIGGAPQAGGETAGARSLELPAGAGLYDLEATETGWVAGGQLPGSEGTDLLLIRQADGEVSLLPVPERGAGRLRGQAVVLVREGELEGIAWVEGDRERDLGVWAAAWEGSDWGDREAVSVRQGGGQQAPDRPLVLGSQLALAGAVLDDGSWLLVWSAFDGQDDETVWSRRREGSWSPPERLHEDNEVPDITPAVTAVEGGALVAWSWLDGSDYRLRTARLDRTGWTRSEPFGDKGSLYPAFLADPDPSGDGGRAWLVYLTVVPASWTVLELGADGAPGRSAVASVSTYDRPWIAVLDEEKVAFEWLEEKNGTLASNQRIEADWGPRP